MGAGPGPIEPCSFRNVAVNEVLDGLMGEVETSIRLMSMHNQANDAAVQSCISDVLEAFTAYDLPVERLSRSTSTWATEEPDSEPSPSQPDTWIRGAVPRSSSLSPSLPQGSCMGAEHAGAPSICRHLLLCKLTSFFPWFPFPGVRSELEAADIDDALC